jgi:hypothetical protein
MSKRSAALVAAFLVGAMALGAMALSLGAAGPTPANAFDSARPQRVVKVQRKTITIHRKADAAPAPGAIVSIVSSGSDDDAGEDGFEHEDDDGDEHEVEHEDRDEIEVEDD